MDTINTLPNGKSKITLPAGLIPVIDVLLVNLGFILAFAARFGFRTIPAGNWVSFLNIVPWVSIISILLFITVGLYSVRRHSFRHVIRLLFIAVFMLSVFTMAIAFWDRSFAVPRSVILVSLPVQLLLLAGWRYCAFRLDKYLHGVKQLMIVGNRDDVEQMLTKILAMPRGWFEVSGVYPPTMIEKVWENINKVNAVLITDKVPLEIRQQILIKCFEYGKEAFVLPSIYEILLKKSVFTQMGDTPLIEVPELLETPIQLFFKRSMDLVIGTSGFIVALPIFVILLPLIKLTSPGAIFYSQKRVGYRGKIFDVLKFRSMVADAEVASGPVFATENDARVTKIGRIMRATRLDELPQLINIIRGDMSLVGPRPERPEFVSQFLEELPEYRLRYLVKPGLTGLAQVRSTYATNVENKLRYDLDYIINYSVFLDIKILVETIPTVLSKDAAKGCQESTHVYVQKYFQSR